MFDAVVALSRTLSVLFSNSLSIATVTFSSNVEGGISEDGVITVIFSGMTLKLLAGVSSTVGCIVSFALCNAGSMVLGNSSTPKLSGKSGVIIRDIFEVTSGINSVVPGA